MLCSTSEVDTPSGAPDRHRGYVQRNSRQAQRRHDSKLTPRTCPWDSGQAPRTCPVGLRTGTMEDMSSLAPDRHHGGYVSGTPDRHQGHVSGTPDRHLGHVQLGSRQAPRTCLALLQKGTKDMSSLAPDRHQGHVQLGSRQAPRTCPAWFQTGTKDMSSLAPDRHQGHVQLGSRQAPWRTCPVGLQTGT